MNMSVLKCSLKLTDCNEKSSPLTKLICLGNKMKRKFKFYISWRENLILKWFYAFEKVAFSAKNIIRLKKMRA